MFQELTELMKDEEKNYEYIRLNDLNKEFNGIDLLISKNNGNVGKTNNNIGHIMRTYNIIEYKSPDEDLSIDDYYKAIGCACLYKAMGRYVDEIPAGEVTVSLFCTKKPIELFATLKDEWNEVEEKYSGIYYIKGNTLFPIQIVVIKELDKESHSGLRVLSYEVEKEDAEGFLHDSVKSKKRWERENIKIVLQASMSANPELYADIQKDPAMRQAIKEILNY